MLDDQTSGLIFQFLIEHVELAINPPNLSTLTPRPFLLSPSILLSESLSQSCQLEAIMSLGFRENPEQYCLGAAEEQLTHSRSCELISWQHVIGCSGL